MNCKDPEEKELMYFNATSTLEGDVATYSCVDNYDFGDREKKNVTCQSDGTWTTFSDTCRSE